jgi:acyl-coenzyme A synthetase/AMP-(fatty) acid ligase
LLAGDLEAPIARVKGERISRGAYLADVNALAARLPVGRFGMNLCRNRYGFLVAFGALLVAGRVNLLPHSAAPRLIDEIGADYDAFRIDDDALAAIRGVGEPVSGVPDVRADQPAAVLFTSGSTGKPTAQIKTWGELVGSTGAALQRFGLQTALHAIVATVPPQHSYGFESSILYALQGPAVLHDGHPLFPADVHAALAAMAPPRVLVTTPLHLEACLEAGLDWPAIAFAISATSPLGRELAARAEKTLNAPMLEIYGSSETGAIASRRSATETVWTPYEGVRVYREAERFHVTAPFLPAPRLLSDRLALTHKGAFEWRGRHADQIKIAGKRISLVELNARLLAIPGVEDGGFVLPDGAGRLAALVIAPSLEPETIRGQLAEAIDPVFLPRPLLRVEALEHTATGKLSRAELLRHLENPMRNTVYA